jgi:PAS domain S-box-containing protein
MSRTTHALPPASVQEGVFHAAFLRSPAMQSVIRATDGILIEVNEMFLMKLGFAREQVIGRTAAELNFWADPEELAAYRAAFVADGHVSGREVRLRATDGRLLNVLLSTHPVDIGGAAHLVSAGVDVTARREAEARLRDNEAHTRALYDSVTAAVVVHDETGFLQANAAAVRMFGASRPEELIGLHLAQTSAHLQPDGEPSVAAAQRYVARALAGNTMRFEWLARRLDGAEFSIEVTLTALPLGGRTVIQAVMHDLTERKRAESELQIALDKERELRQLKSEFVSLVSHEFRTPLEVIMSSADNLARYHDRLAPEQRGELLRTINKSVRRMSGMMEEVLVLGRLEGERMTFRPEPLDLAAFCRRVSDELASATGGRCPIELRVTAAGTACGDENLLRHIFTNVLSNAIKYSPEGEPVVFAVGRDGVHAVCRVADRGCGIPAADQARLFQAFHRGANVRQVPGTGLGLLIVRRCIDLHGGEIAFESAEGRGTTCTVRLPLFAPVDQPETVR